MKNKKNVSDKKMASSKIVYACNILLDAVGMRDGYTKAHCHRCTWLSQTIYAKYLRALFADNSVNFETYAENYMRIVEEYEILNQSKEMLLDYRSIFLAWACDVHDMAKIAWSDLMLKGPRHENEECGRCGSTCIKVRSSHPEEAAKRLLESFNAKPKAAARRLTWVALVLFHHRNYSDQEIFPRGYPATIESISDSVVREFAEHCNRETKMLEILRPGESETNPMRLMLGIIRLVDSLDAMTSKRSYKNIENILKFENNAGKQLLKRWSSNNFIVTDDDNHIYQEAYDAGRERLFRQCMKGEWERYKNDAVPPIVLQTYQDWLEGECGKACKTKGITPSDWRESKIKNYINRSQNTEKYDRYRWYQNFNDFKSNVKPDANIDDRVKFYLKNFTFKDYDDEAESRYSAWAKSQGHTEISKDEWLLRFDYWTSSILQIEENMTCWVKEIWEPCVLELEKCTEKGVYHPAVWEVLDKNSIGLGRAFFETKYMMYPDSPGDLYPCKSMADLLDTVKLA